MPWEINERSGKYCVVNKDSGKTEKCHPTKQAAKDHMAALYANEPKAWQEAMGNLLAMYDESFPFGRAKARVTAPDGSVREFDCALADTEALSGPRASRGGQAGLSQPRAQCSASCEH